MGPADAIQGKRPAQDDSETRIETPKRTKLDVVAPRPNEQSSVSDKSSSSLSKTQPLKKKRRPAPPQVDPATFKVELPVQTGTIFNIWYNKWSGGDREDKFSSKTKALSRCNIAKHTGYTKADSLPGSYVCLFFARGMCPRGRDCEYLHRLPGTFDIYSGNVDCFGREKHSDYRDDMGGVGSFTRQNRTLYVGRIHPTDDIEEIVARHFAEWGRIERTRVLPTRGVAFVTYATESLAQFAREAMAHQSLDNNEILNVRWATIDPNPAAQKREADMIEQQAALAVRRALPDRFWKGIENGSLESKLLQVGSSPTSTQDHDSAHQPLLLDKESYKHPSRTAANTTTSSSKMLLPNDSPFKASGEIEARHHGKGPQTSKILSTSTLRALEGYASDANRSLHPVNGTSVALVDYDSDES